MNELFTIINYININYIYINYYLLSLINKKKVKTFLWDCRFVNVERFINLTS